MRQNFVAPIVFFFLCGPVGGGKSDGMPTQTAFSVHFLVFKMTFLSTHAKVGNSSSRIGHFGRVFFFFACTGFQVKEICTRGPKMVAAARSDTIEACVKKMIAADVRHLPVIDDDTGEVFGLISVKASRQKAPLLSSPFFGVLFGLFLCDVSSLTCSDFLPL